MHVNKNSEIVNKNIFHLAINIFDNNNKFHFTLQCINASCHHALRCVIIMNLMIHMYFINKGEFFFQNHMNKKLSHFWVYGYCKVTINVSKNINTLLIGVVYWYF